MTKILLLGDEAPESGGAQGRLAQLGRALIEEGHEVHVVASAVGEEAALWAKRSGVTFRAVPPEAFEASERLLSVFQSIAPAAMIATSSSAAWRAAELAGGLPLWVDLPTDLGSSPGSAAPVATIFGEWWRWTSVLDRADVFSCASETQRLFLLALTGWRGRLQGADPDCNIVQAWALATDGAEAPELAALLDWACQPARAAARSTSWSAREATLLQRVDQLETELVTLRGTASRSSSRLVGRLRHGVGRVARRLASWLWCGLMRVTQVVFHGWMWSWLLIYCGWQQTWAWLRRRFRGHEPPMPSGSGAELASLAGKRPRLLIVCPYAIYPPNHGGAVRLYNLVKQLAERCDLYLLIFSPERETSEQRQALEPYCRRVYFHHWQPVFEREPWSAKPPSARLFASQRAAQRILEIVKTFAIDVVQLEYTELAQYRHAAGEARVILVEHDVAFRSFWRRRGLGFAERFPHSRAFGATFGDWLQLLRYELRACRAVDQVHVMSPHDGAYLASFLTDGIERMRVVPNAVDVAYYRPPVTGERQGVLMVGNFENLPNLDAFEYFLTEIWPLVRQRQPTATLSVVGAKMPPEMNLHHGRDGISIVGTVDDMRPSYHGHRVLVVPLRAGSGTRLKLFEAFASGIPAVSTTLGAEGIDYIAGEHLLIADEPPAFATAIERLLSDDQLHASISQAGLRLAEERYDWRFAAEENLRGILALIGDRESGREAHPAAVPDVATDPLASQVEISIILPTLNGGKLLGKCLQAIADQEIDRVYEVICVDSGSRAEDLELMRRFDIRLEAIDKKTFNHGLTRDLGASLARGRVLVFLNQDAVPCDRSWLARLTAPLFASDPPAAVQGGILELPHENNDVRRFFWDSCGERFYFTRESNRWIQRYHGIGFSTVNAALRRDVWQRIPFGWAPIMEDKKWQREVVEAGYTILAVHEAAVHHTHDYDLRSLKRRCESEGFGWQMLGETYAMSDMLRDMVRRRVQGELWRGVLRGRVKNAAEFLFPWLRPWMLYIGNRWSKQVKL